MFVPAVDFQKLYEAQIKLKRSDRIQRDDKITKKMENQINVTPLTLVGDKNSPHISHFI